MTHSGFHQFKSNQWALILGGSSGFGLATAKLLSSRGMSVCVVHRDRRGSMAKIEKDFDEIKNHGGKFIAMNLDALSIEGMNSVINRLKSEFAAEDKLQVVLHSIAFGNLKPLHLLEEDDMARTIHAMGTSLLSWTQKLHQADLFAPDARVLSLTSEGNSAVWKGYAAVSAAKCALESVSRSLAVEYGPLGIRSNVIQAGVTDTPALRMIPGSDEMMASAVARNPLGRLTRTQDIANVVGLLCSPEASWINGALIRVDGGEHVSAR